MSVNLQSTAIRQKPNNAVKNSDLTPIVNDLVAINDAMSGGGTISGTITTNYVAKGTALDTIGNSQIFDNGNNVGISTILPTAKLHVKGIDALSTSYALKLDNIANTSLFTINNIGQGTILDINFGKGKDNVTSNTAFGVSALGAVVDIGTTYENTAFGYNAMAAHVTGSDNIAIGANALKNATISAFNVAIGANALINSDNYYNTAINNSATGTNLGHNVSIGYLSTNVNTGGNNTAIGNYSFCLGTSSNNTAIGYQSMASGNQSGGTNTAIGFFSLYSNTGSENLAIGASSGYDNNTGSGNIFIGNESGRYLGAGQENTIIGSNYTFLRDDAFGQPLAWDNTLSNNIILSDGSGNLKFQSDANGNSKFRGDSVGLLLSEISFSTHVGSGVGGTLSADTYYYYLTALNATGETPIMGAVSNTLTGATSSVAFTWASVIGATGYRIYRRKLSDGNAVVAEYYDVGNVLTYTDTNAVVTGTANPNLVATAYSNKMTAEAFMLPSLTTTERDAIATPLKGMVIYNTTTNVLNFYNGAWGAV
jgi:hypothetical protein